MKTIPPPCPEPETGPKYWRSLDELAERPEFREWVEREFPAGASELTDPLTRRHFVKIMSASFLLAGLGMTGCRRPEEKIMPFGKQPENYVHGVPVYYATAYPTRGSAIPLVVKSHDGRPTKIEGNALHPDSNGATDQFAHALFGAGPGALAGAGAGHAGGGGAGGGAEAGRGLVLFDGAEQLAFAAAFAGGPAAASAQGAVVCA
jgi:MoCo/4Fe-4S cofactor protein with predicted Tat translocation signal